MNKFYIIRCNQIDLGEYILVSEKMRSLERADRICNRLNLKNIYRFIVVHHSIYNQFFAI